MVATDGQYNETRQCSADFDFTFNYNNTAVAPASLGEIKAGFHES